jgi:hypothetical protein
MLNIISTLLVFVINAIKYVLEFLTIIILGVVGAVLYALPWLLRIVALLLWLGGDYLGINLIETIYAPFSPAIPVIALQFALILMSVGWLLIILSKNTKLVWGGMAAGGLVIGGASFVSSWLLSHWRYADLFFRVLPPALFSVLLICETIRLRSMHRNGKTLFEAGRKIVHDTEEMLLNIKMTDLGRINKP